MNKTLILINGLPRAGKDTVADYITSNHSALKMSFATPMKNIIANTFGITLDELDTYKNNTDEYGVELKAYPNNQPQQVIKYTNFREILQLFGTEGMKPEFGTDVWSNLLYLKVLQADAELVVVPDYRFMCEYKPQPGINIIRILVKDERDLPTEGHASDVELYQNNVEFDYVINNVGTLDELYENVNIIMQQIGT
jgi:hypothetical protein